MNVRWKPTCEEVEVTAINRINRAPVLQLCTEHASPRVPCFLLHYRNTSDNLYFDWEVNPIKVSAPLKLGMVMTSLIQTDAAAHFPANSVTLTQVCPSLLCPSLQVAWCSGLDAWPSHDLSGWWNWEHTAAAMAQTMHVNGNGPGIQRFCYVHASHVVTLKWLRIN